MTKLKSEVQITLENDIIYHHSGNEVKTKSIILKAPSSKQKKQSNELAQWLVQAIKQATKDEATKEATLEHQNDSSDMSDNPMAIIYLIMASDVKFEIIENCCLKLLSSGGALLDGKESLTEFNYDQLSLGDSYKLIGGYLVNFLIPYLIPQK